MMLHRMLRGGAAFLMALLAVGTPSARAQRAANVPASIQLSHDLGLSDTSQEINITVHLKLDDGFDKALDALYDPASPSFHHWMSNADLMKYAPSEQQRDAVRRELENHGLTIISTDPIGFTIRAHGTIANVAGAFNTELHDFNYNGKTYRANIRDASLSGEAGNYVFTVAGLESHKIRPMIARAVNLRTNKPYPAVPLTVAAKNAFPAVSTANCLSGPVTYKLGKSLPTAVYTGTAYSANSSLICDYLPQQLWAAVGLDDVFANGYNGKGQTIVLVEGYGYPTMQSDANAFYTLAGLPLLTSSNFRILYPEGKPNPQAGILTGWNVEIALDMDWSHSVAPGANMVVLATNGQDNEDFQASILYAAEHNLGNSISNSYEEDLDLIAGALEQTSWEQTLKIATAKGISVNFSTGDGGDDGLGTPVGAPGVPSVAPHATAVGGTSILNDPTNPGSTITTSWGDTISFVLGGGGVLDPPVPAGLIGGGGGGESTFWAKPAWQSALPGTGRQTPDVSALADPYTGVPIVLTNGTQQVIEYGWGGTSLATPIFSGFWALANQKAGHALGQAARAIAALPYGGVQDVLPASDISKDNVSGSVTDSKGTTKYSANALFGPVLEGNKNFTSAFWLEDPLDLIDFGFGIDSSLTVTKGWDNATGYGTPYGLTFLNAVAK